MIFLSGMGLEQFSGMIKMDPQITDRGVPAYLVQTAPKQLVDMHPGTKQAVAKVRMLEE
jgi:hypothetical protein